MQKIINSLEQKYVNLLLGSLLGSSRNLNETVQMQIL